MRPRFDEREKNVMSTSLPAINEELRSQEAYQRVAHRIAAVPLTDLQLVNLDITSAVATVLGALPEIRAVRPEMEKLPGLDLAAIDQLEDLALALRHVNTQYLTAAAPPDDLTGVSVEGSTLRENLRGDAEQLVRRGWLNPQSLAGVSGGNGYKNLAKDLEIYCAVLRASWCEIKGKCGTDVAELDHAERVANRILRIVGLREQAPAILSSVSEDRLKAFTLFVRTYDEVRRAVSFLRWQDGDTSSIAPSLYAGRGGRGKGEVDPPAVAPTAPAGAASASTTPSVVAASTTAPTPLAARVAPLGLSPRDPFLP